MSFSNIKMVYEKIEKLNAIILDRQLNWLFALNTGALGAVIVLSTSGHIKGAILYPSALYFFFSLVCLLLRIGTDWLFLFIVFIVWLDKIKIQNIEKLKIAAQSFEESLKTDSDINIGWRWFVWFMFIVPVVLTIASPILLLRGAWLLIHNTIQ